MTRNGTLRVQPVCHSIITALSHGKHESCTALLTIHWKFHSESR